MKKRILSYLIIFFICLPGLQAQTVLEIDPLFDYPVAPEEMVSLEERCNYIVKNFWNSFDAKSKKPVDQYALNEAFEVYATSFRFADAKEVENSVDKLLKSVSGNPVLLLQITKAAEEKLYGPRATLWADNIYIKFLDAIINNKKIPAARKEKYINQKNPLVESAIGKTAPNFWFEDRERASKQYFPMSTPTLLIFGDPDNLDWRLHRIKMDSNLKLSEALDKGKVNILFIIPNEIENWQSSVSNYNSHWTIGQSKEVSRLYDLRLSPAMYVIGSDGKIVNKNILPEDAVSQLLEIIN